MSARIVGTDYGELPSVIGAKTSAVRQRPSSKADVVPKLETSELSTGNVVCYEDGILRMGLGVIEEQSGLKASRRYAGAHENPVHFCSNIDGYTSDISPVARFRPMLSPWQYWNGRARRPAGLGLTFGSSPSIQACTRGEAGVGRRGGASSASSCSRSAPAIRTRR